MAEVKEPVVAETKPAPEIKIDLDAVKATEAKRIQDCMAQLRDDSNDATKALCFVAGNTPGDIAMAVNAEVKAMGDKFLDNLAKAEDTLASPSPAAVFRRLAPRNSWICWKAGSARLVETS